MYFTIFIKDDISSKHIADYLKKLCFENGLKENNENFDIVFVVGGDGSVLRAVHKYIDRLDSCMFAVIHTGTLGFYSDVNSDDLSLFINNVVKNNYYIDSRKLLKIEAKESYYALNEMRIENNMRTQILDVFVDGETLENFRGNGFCVSSPSGSTAYNKSLGGSVIIPSLEVISLTEIAGIHNNKYHSLNSPLIIGNNSFIEFKSSNLNDSVLGIDHLNYKLENINSVKVMLSDKKVKFIRMKNYSFIKKLRNCFINDL